MKKIVVTLGVFDGLHRGHQHIFQKLIQRAHQIGGVSLAYTFNPHPARVLAPKAAPSMIMTLEQRVNGMKKMGIEKIVVQKFSRSFAGLSPVQFFNRILVKKLKAHEIFVGYDFTFGHHRTGNVNDLKEMGKKEGIRVHVVEPFFWKETLVSSTHIRRLLTQGNLPEASDLLGHPYSLSGKVIKGRGIGGRELSIHTANLKVENERILPTGVYVTTTWVNGKRHESVTNIGPNPTFGPGKLSVETHLFHFNQNIRGKRIEVEFLKKIREEITFSSAQELKQQIENDIQAAKSYFVTL